ncbi:hypothetical protein JCGZ_22370 [Jatropha curcas]|uniref:AMP-dependent synthetase/ligase domain-containing protein n=1 Tax=Jatropha curcas TaxID=180498 RepID=A0A067L966_JATCU|nr:hypothetical protein JCGZ_22370 [Jatropha curcas]
MNHLFKNKSYYFYCTRFISSSFNRFLFNFPQNSRVLSHFPGDVEPESWKTTEGLVRCSANFVPLSPISFLERAAKVYRDRKSVVYGSVVYTWNETYKRCLSLASTLTRLGISRGDVVS